MYSKTSNTELAVHDFLKKRQVFLGYFYDVLNGSIKFIKSPTVHYATNEIEKGQT